MVIDKKNWYILAFAIIIVVMMPNTKSVCLERYYGCQICLNLTHCQTCYQHHGLVTTGPDEGTCKRCTGYYCQRCSGDYPALCFQCRSYFDIINGSCVQAQTCNNSLCIYCPSDPQICLACQQQILGIGLLNNTCINCAVSNCIRCLLDANNCTRCRYYYGLYILNGVASCQNCSHFNPHCIDCSFNVSFCYRCSNGYGVNLTSTALNCIPCQDTLTCVECGYGSKLCQNCVPGYGIALSGCQLCTSSPSKCADCNTKNLEECTSCPPELTLMPDLTCACIAANCSICLTQITCHTCLNGFYRDPNDQCFQCPILCSRCVYDITYSQPSCTACLSSLYEVDYQPGICRDICGDYIIIQNQCENQLWISWDGCNDNCQVEPDFICVPNSMNQPQICYYTGDITFTFLRIQRQGFKNKFVLFVSLYPPLNAFRITPELELKSIFRINNSSIVLQEVKYDPQTSILQFLCSFQDHIYQGQNIQIFFEPIYGSTHQYFEPNTLEYFVIVIPDTIQYYSAFSIMVADIVLIVCWVNLVLAWISFIISLIVRKLPGLEAMFVMQIAWVCFVISDLPKFIETTQTFPIYYTNGYNHDFYQEIQNQKKPIKFSRKFFINSFNISIVQPILALVGIIVTTIRLKKYLNMCNKNKCQLSQEKSQSLLDQNQASYQYFMFSNMFNLMNFVVSATFYYKQGQTSNIASNLMFSIELLMLLINFIKFACDPSLFDCFLNQFRPKTLALNHYWLYIIFLVLSPVFLVLLSFGSYIALAMCLTLILYTIIYKPYKYTKQNIRSGYNFFVKCCLIAYTIYVKLNTQKNINYLPPYIAFLVILCLLIPLTLVISIIASVYYYHYEKYVLPKIDNERISKQGRRRNKLRQFLNQYVNISDFNQQIKKQKKKTVFKEIIKPQASLFDASFTLKEIRRVQQQNCQNQKPMRIQGMQESTSNAFRQLKQKIKAQKIINPKVREKFYQNTLIQQQPQDEQHTNQTKKGLKIDISDGFQDSNTCRKLRDQIEDHQIAGQILVDQNRFAQMRGAFDKVTQQMSKPNDPNADIYLQQFNKIDRNV